jgi:very-short-patch-repair endonuclease
MGIMQFHDVHLSARERRGVVRSEKVRSRKQRARLIQQGFVQTIRRGALLLAGHRRDWDQRVIAAQLVIPNSAISHRSAARIWGFGEDDSRFVEVVAERRHRRNGVRCHSTDSLPTRHVIEHDGFVVTTPERTLIDLAAVVPQWTLQKALDNALRLRLTTPLRVAAELETRRGSGHHGTRRLASMLLPLLLAPAELNPGLERKTWAWLQAFELPLPERQTKFVLDGKPIFVDFFWPNAKLVVEVDGGTWHDNIESFHNDRKRDLGLGALGIQVFRVTSRTTPHELYAAVTTRL